MIRVHPYINNLPNFTIKKIDDNVLRICLLLVITVSLIVAATFSWTYNYVKTVYNVTSYGAKLSTNEFVCLVENIYYEAGNQPMTGKIAVGYVTMNRKNSGFFPKDLCNVVYQKTYFEKTSTCQFSWTCLRRPKINSKMWLESTDAAYFIINKYNPSYDPTMGATFYHAHYVKPNWNNLQRTVKIEDHIFYRHHGY